MARKNKTLAGVFEQFDDSLKKQDENEKIDESLSSQKEKSEESSPSEPEVTEENKSGKEGGKSVDQTPTPEPEKSQEDQAAVEATPLPTEKETIQEDKIMNHTTESDKKEEIPTSNTAMESSSATETKNPETMPENDKFWNESIRDIKTFNPETSPKTIKDITDSIMSMYDEKTKKKTVEETHTRATFLFRKDLQARLDKLADGKRGFKTLFLNKAVETLLDEMEGYNK